MLTEEDKERLLKAKADVSAELASEDIARYRLFDIDPRLHIYVDEVAGNPTKHNLFEQLGVKLFLRKCQRYGLRKAKILQFYTLYEMLFFPGKRGLQRYKLTPVQCFQYASIFGFWVGSHRVVREAALFLPRKFSKTTSSAAFAIHDLLYGDANAESYTCANSADQAKKCFDVIRDAIRRLDPNELRYIVNEQKIKSRREDRQAFAQCLTANAKTKDGLNSSTTIMDEFSQARDATLLNVLTTSTGVRENPLTVIITTASDVFDGPFYEMLQGYKAVLLGDNDDDSLFAHIFEPDLGDDESDPATWRKVHPHMGVTVSEEFYASEYKAARRKGAEGMLAFRTKLLNLYVENERTAWISATTAAEHARPMSVTDIKGQPEGMVAIDLSESQDFSAVSVAWYDAREDAFNFITDYFFPEGALPGHPNEKLYRKWAEQGHLHLLPGNVIDYRAIVEHVMRIDDYVTILSIGYDAWKSGEVINMLSLSGFSYRLKPVSQTIGNFTAPTQAFEHGIKTGKIWINANPINYYCFGNCVLMEDNNENIKPEKRTYSQRIDGVITKLMCERLIIDLVR